jgi:hypothetical protein
MKTTWVVALCALTLGVEAAVAQDDLQYQRRNNRNEGIKPKPVSGYAVELLSARVDYQEDMSGRAGKLAFRFFLERPTSVHAVVRELEYKHYYWLDNIQPTTPWQAGYGNVFEWPTRDVIGRLEGFNPSELGIVVRLGKATPSLVENVAPVVFYQSGVPPRAKGYIFIFRLREDGNVTATIFRDGVEQPLARQHFSRQSGGRPFAVKWDPKTEMPEGPYRVVLKGYALDTNDEINQTVTFYHQPAIASR